MELLISAFMLTIAFPQSFINLGIFQQNHYDIKKYLINLKKHYFKTLSTYLEYVVLLFIIIYYFIPKWYIISLILSFLILSFMTTKKLIIVPRVTKRLKRLVFSASLISSIWYFLFPNHLLICMLEIILGPVILIFTTIINWPIELGVNKYYCLKAKKKLRNIHPYVIGITGSYGKTSTKNIIYELLKTKYLALKSPASYNTPAGLCKTINEHLNDLTEVLITELGATKPGDIWELSKLVSPQIGVITEIGPQHLESFKSVENVLKTKLEILKSPNIEMLIINNDNQYLREYRYPSNLEIVTIGIDYPAKYQAKNIQLLATKLCFDIYIDGIFVSNISTSLLAKHNIYNILLGIAVAKKMGIDEITKVINNLQPTKHRLSIKDVGSNTILDDSFNSNIVGFTNALEVLHLSNKTKVVITPGIVEAGDKMVLINQEIAEKLMKFEKIFLINNPATKYIKEYFEKKGFVKYEVFSNFALAYQKALEEFPHNTTILIENDLPDNYLRR